MAHLILRLEIPAAAMFTYAPSIIPGPFEDVEAAQLQRYLLFLKDNQDVPPYGNIMSLNSFAIDYRAMQPFAILMDTAPSAVCFRCRVCRSRKNLAIGRNV